MRILHKCRNTDVDFYVNTCRIKAMSNTTTIEKAIKIAGTASDLARGIRVPIQSVTFWRKGERRVPADYCPAIEEFTNGQVRCEDLRPDVNWGVLRGTAAEKHAEAA